MELTVEIFTSFRIICSVKVISLIYQNQINSLDFSDILYLKVMDISAEQPQMILKFKTTNAIMEKQNIPLLSHSEKDNTPWNEVVNPPRKVDVTVTMTISKTFTVETTEYTMEKDINEDGNVGVIYKYADGALERAVDEQVTLPNQAYDELHHAVFLTEDYQARDSMEDLNGWHTESLEVKCVD